MKKAKNIDFQRCKYLILNFCKDVKKISWPKEVKIAKQLLRKYPSFDSWIGISMGDKPSSLSWFLTDEGKQFLAIAEKSKNLIWTPKRVILYKKTNSGKIRQSLRKTKVSKTF